MKTYVVFDRKTGEILRTHVQTDDHSDAAEHISKTASPDLQRVAVDVLEVVEPLTPSVSYRVDLKQKKLVATEPNKTRGSGGAIVQSSAGVPRSGRRSFIDARTNKKL
jgi:hypothetical protein